MGPARAPRQSTATIRWAFSRLVQAFVEHPRRNGFRNRLLTEAFKLSQGAPGYCVTSTPERSVQRPPGGLNRASNMASTTPQAGAVSFQECGSGSPAEPYRCPAAVIGGRDGDAPAGLALKLDPTSDSYNLVLLDEGNQPLMALGTYPEEDVVAEWRTLGAASGLTLKIQLGNGAVITPYPQIGRVRIGPVRIRRRHGLLAHRRPRFLTRRKTGSFGLRPQVHREREIADGSGF